MPAPRYANTASLNFSKPFAVQVQLQYEAFNLPTHSNRLLGTIPTLL